MEIFWHGQENSLCFCADPGYLQLKFLFLVVLVDEVNAGRFDQVRMDMLADGHSHSSRFKDRLPC